MAVPETEVEVLTWSVFGDASQELARMVAHSGYRPGIILGIARGGLLPAAAMAYALDRETTGHAMRPPDPGFGEILPALTLSPRSFLWYF